MADAWVYLLRCADDSLYCGWTTDVEKRVDAHARGVASKYTRTRRPVELAASWPFEDASAARREEWRIKQLTRAEKLALVGEAADQTCRPRVARSASRPV
jgi:putative endonuclease